MHAVGATTDTEKDGVRRFHYGTHYSSAASVSSYLLRLQPFTAYHLARPAPEGVGYTPGGLPPRG